MSDLGARICCLDLDTFFVSVERLLDPSLVGKPVVVGGRTGQRGVVTAASYEVRRFGVHSGMPMAEAVRLAPGAIFLPTRHGTYSPYSAQVRELLEQWCPVVRPASIDEFYLDFRGCERMYHRPGDADGDATILRVVRALRQAIQDQLGLPASAGLGATKTVAKIGSGLAKPAGVVQIAADQAVHALGELPARKVPGIGPVATAALTDAGVHTIGQLLALPPGPVRARFSRLSDSVRKRLTVAQGPGLGRSRPAFHEHDPTSGGSVGSISNERTFRADVGDDTTVRKQLRSLAERVCWRARKRQVRARTIGLKLRYADFQTISRSRTVPPTHHEADVLRIVDELFTAARTRPLPIRLLGVQLSNLVGVERQLALPFDGAAPGGRPPRAHTDAAIDEVRKRFGYDAIRLGVAGETSSWLG